MVMRIADKRADGKNEKPGTPILDLITLSDNFIKRNDFFMVKSEFHYVDYRVKEYRENALYKHVYLKRKVALHSYYRGKNKGRNEGKLLNSISRAKSIVRDYALCNDFDFFVTLTLSPEKYDRKDLKKYISDLALWIRHYRQKWGTPLEYLLIPERHKDGAWHMHGFIQGQIHDLTVNDNGYMDWYSYSKKFGWISLDYIKNKEACAHYITKYITKNCERSVSELGAHMYYVSRGLVKPEEILQLDVYDYARLDMGTVDFSNDYCDIAYRNGYNILDKLASDARKAGIMVKVDEDEND